MTVFETYHSRPKMNRRVVDDPQHRQWDLDLEYALLNTAGTGTSIKVPLVKFHRSPSKGRLWKKGWSVKHRLLPDDTVAAWVEEPRPRKKVHNEPTS